ncbi:MAG: ABC transporter ATP-binding protein [Clostridia bacterium]|jgi:ATP-binding cassette subfamily B protein|nr:ABC transporter ATP-binding protein [Clostridia bacterium]
MGPPNRNRNQKKQKPKNTKATAKRLFSYLEQEKHKIAAAFVCVLVSSASTLCGSYLLRPIINGLIDSTKTSQQKITSLMAGLALMAVVYVLGVGATYLQGRIMISVSQGTLKRIREHLFRKVQKLPVRYFDTNPTGDIMSRFTNDVDIIGEMLNSTLVQIFSGTITLIGTLALMLYTNWVLAVVTIVVSPIIAKIGTAIAGKSRKYFMKQQTDLGKVNGYIEETVTGQKVVKVFNYEKNVVNEFSELNQSLRNSQVKAQFISGIMGPCMNAMSQVNYTLTACVGSIIAFASRWGGGVPFSALDIGGLTVFVNYSRQFSRPINELAQQVTNIMSALAGAERVFNVMDETEEIDDGKKLVLDKVHGDVLVEGVTFGYNPDKTILKDVSVFAHPGQKIALVGSTGAGKTTITNLITRFYNINKGKITIDGVDIKDISLECLRENIAMVLQDTHLFTGTIMENIRYGRLSATDEEVRQAAKTSCADMFIKNMPEGYDTMLKGDGSNLSQGQRQLLNIARAALSKAPILVLDEATSSVDTRTEKHINEGMDALMEDRTTFVIAHRLSTIRNADAIMVLENGEIIERGTHEELLEKKGRYFELYTGLKELD